MRAFRRHLFALLVIPAVVFLASTPAHAAGTSAHVAASAVSSSVKLVPGDCPAGTNWDDILQECVPV
jgi:hypothetical protein